MVSFSTRIKKELLKQPETARHCMIAELAAIVDICRAGEGTAFLYSENKLVQKRCMDLIGGIFEEKLSVSIDDGNFLRTGSREEKEKLFRTLKIKEQIEYIVIQHTCCKRCFIRGAFLASGSVSDPQKAYHLEIVYQNMGSALLLQDAMSGFQIEAKIVERGRYFVVYLKEGAQIVDVLNVMGAHVALMELENVRIVKEMRNSINRQVNCETANLNKTVIAASKQIEDILLIEEHLGLGSLPEVLEETARMRIQYPDLALKELGEMLGGSIGKSGVNHRLKKLGSIADAIRAGRNEGA